MEGASPSNPPDGATHLHPLYALHDVEAALGPADDAAPEVDPDWAFRPPGEAPVDTEHQRRLAAVLARGERGRWRRAEVPEPEVVRSLNDLGARAPHFAEVVEVIDRHVRAAINAGVPLRLPHMLLLSEPGTGKTWFLSRLGEILSVPFRSYSMAAATLGEGLQGSHPSWRNAAPGLVAKTLLGEPVCNPLLFVDEMDKAESHAANGDPWRPFYGLLDRSGSRAFVDEYLQFPIDASRVNWVLAANDLDVLPAPIVDRLTVIPVPHMAAEHAAAVVASIYTEANDAMNGYFSPDLEPALMTAFAGMSVRGIRIAVEEAMMTAAADGRQVLRAGDLAPRRREERKKIGFHR